MDRLHKSNIIGAALALALGAVLALALLAPSPARAQITTTGVRPGGGDGGGEPPRPSVTYNPERVRALLLSIHGYTREGLQAASTNADEILMMLAGDGQEEMVVRRQAIKGLRLFPSDGTLSFIEREVGGAPEGLKRLYLSSLGGFAQAFPDRVGALAESALNDPLVNVRFSALKLTGELGQTPRVRSMLQSRLAAEPDAKLRAAIQQRLGAN